jgi:hypothetical protein
MRQCLSEGGKRGFQAAGALADLHAQRSAHSLSVDQVKESTNSTQKLGKLDGQGGKRKGAM